MIEQDPTEYAKADEDKAALLQDSLNAQGIQAVQALMARESHPDFDGQSCVECLDLLPQVRRDLGRVRCVHCQAKKEQRAKYFRTA